MTDGLPVTPPTRERVDAMLKHCGFDGAEVVTMLPPAFEEATWRDIAINAVMAGCLPAYLPVVGAAVNALAAPEFNLIGVATTTGSAWPVVIVNGPIVAELGMNVEGNVLGPGNRANAAIGRAVNLALRNIGGAKPGELDMIINTRLTTEGGVMRVSALLLNLVVFTAFVMPLHGRCRGPERPARPACRRAVAPRGPSAARPRIRPRSR